MHIVRVLCPACSPSFIAKPCCVAHLWCPAGQALQTGNTNAAAQALASAAASGQGTAAAEALAAAAAQGRCSLQLAPWCPGLPLCACCMHA